MGTMIISQGADYRRNARAIRTPVMTGLEYWGRFGGTLAQTKQNLVLGKAAATVVGAPTIAATYASFKSASNYLATDVLDADTVSMIAVVRSSDTFVDNAHSPFIISNFSDNASPTSGTSLYLTAHGSSPAPAAKINAASFRSTGTPAIANANLFPTNMASWHFLAGIITPAQSKVVDKTLGVPATAAGTGARFLNNQPFLIGSAEVATWQGSCDIAVAAIWRGYELTDADLTALYAFVKADLARDGIAI